MELKKGYTFFGVNKGKIHIFYYEHSGWRTPWYLCGLDSSGSDKKKKEAEVTEPEVCKKCLKKYNKMIEE